LPSLLRLQGWSEPRSGCDHTKWEPTLSDLTQTPRAHEDELEQLRRRVAELEPDARRFQALFASGVLSVQRYRADGQTVAVNDGWTRLWRAPEAAALQYNVLADEQLRGTEVMPLVEGVFRDGRAMAFPAMRYDPKEGEQVGRAGDAAWVVSTMAPVCDPSGAVQEVIQLHFAMGELRQTEEELRAQNRWLEDAVRARTAELEQKLRLIEEQRDAIKALSTPVLQVWSGVLALPLIGQIDRERARALQEALLHAVVATRARHVLIDVTGVPAVDIEAAGYLRDTVRATQLLGSRCALVGISPAMAETLIALDVSLERIPTFATLRDGLQHAMEATRRAAVAR
jgi:rsbT co-antagonist protein RsbR